MTDSQNAMFLADLKAGKRITPLEGLGLYGSMRLGARRYDLVTGRHDGTKYNIQTEIVKRNGKRVAEYWMEKK